MGAVDDARTLLQDAGIVDGATGWTSVKRFEHDDDGSQLVIIAEDGGPAPEFPASQGVGDSALGEPGVQCRVRGEPHAGSATASKAQEIIDELHGKRSVTVNGTTYYRIRSMTDEPVFAGYDDDRRPSHTVSFRFLRDQD